MSAPAKHVSTDNMSVPNGFGKFAFDREQTITFPKGIPGFHDHQEFALSQLPEGSQPNLMLLRSTAPKDLSFIVQPHSPELDLIQVEDLEEATHQLAIAGDDCCVMLIATLHPSTEGYKMSVNLRAPILIDTSSRMAWQYVLSNEGYSLRHMLD